MTKDLLHSLSPDLRITVDTFYCPWVFENKQQFENFLWNKFGFINNEKELISKEETLKLAHEIAGVNQYNHREYYFGWSLGLITIQSNDAVRSTYSKRILLLELTLMIIILMIYGVLKKFYFYQSEILDNLILIMLGMTIKSAFDMIAPALWKKNE